MSELHSYLVAVRGFLAAMRNHGDFDRLRGEQCESCRLKIRQSNSISMAVATELIGILNGMLFTDQQKSQLQSECTGRIADAPPKGRRPLQNFQNFEAYLTNKLWLAILGEKPLQALGPLAHHLGLLGLRLPSEKTCSRVTALLLYRSHDGLDRKQKHQAYEHVKSVFKKELAVFQTPDSICPTPWYFQKTRHFMTPGI